MTSKTVKFDWDFNWKFSSFPSSQWYQIISYKKTFYKDFTL